MPDMIAVIDLGSNTTRLNVYNILPGQSPELVAEAKRKVRLSEDMGDGKDLINTQATARVLDAMNEFAKVLKGFPDAQVFAVATEAMRRARNGQSLARLLEETTGIPIQIITGDQEAYYDYLAVRQTLPVEDALIIDTGGGSCELILMRGRTCVEKTSLPIGSVVLSEKYTDRGDLSAAAIFRLFNHVHARLSPIDWLREARNLPVIALGGNHRAIGKIYKNNCDEDAPLHGLQITRDHLNSIYIDLLDADSNRRQAMLGKNKERADIISAGLAPLIQTTRLLDSKTIYFCETGLREGVLYSKLNPELQEES